MEPSRLILISYKTGDVVQIQFYSKLTTIVFTSIRVTLVRYKNLGISFRPNESQKESSTPHGVVNRIGLAIEKEPRSIQFTIGPPIISSRDPIVICSQFGEQSSKQFFECKEE